MIKPMIKPIRIGQRLTGPDEPVCIIAEAGVNHNGSLELAKRLVAEARRQGADCVKFQTFKAERVVTRAAAKAAYQQRLTDPAESQLAMLKQLELGDSDFAALAQCCRDEGILFLSTPYSFEDADLLDELGAPAFKIASGQAVELPFLAHVATKGKPMLLSTGMCTLAEVASAVEAIRRAGNEQIILLQCTTNYPSALEDANVRAMVAMGEAFDCLAGYSDHAEGLAASLAAVALGACVLERHFTLDRTLPGPDHTSSMEPAELGELVRLARQTQLSLGSSHKAPCAQEQANLPAMRRSLVAARDIAAGEVLDWSNLCFKRPAGGLSGETALRVAGCTARVAIAADTRIHFGLLA
ncbi:N-acetylneuraminate synthase [Megalodesulfovibrio paquesii]